MALVVQLPNEVTIDGAQQQNKQVAVQGGMASVTMWAKVADDGTAEVIAEKSFSYQGAKDHPKFAEEALRDIKKDIQEWFDQVKEEAVVRDTTLLTLETDILADVK